MTLERTKLWAFRFCAILSLVALAGTWGDGAAMAQGPPDSVVRMVYFTSSECPHCRAVIEEVLKPLQQERGDQVKIKVVDISGQGDDGGIDLDNYEMMRKAEEVFHVEDPGLPMLLVGGEVLVGEAAIRERLPCIVDSCLEAGTEWPDLPGLEAIPVEGEEESGFVVQPGGLGGDEEEVCSAENESACEVPTPVWAVYFYEAGCQQCDRAEYDLRYVAEKNPELVIEEYDVRENAALAEWLGERAGVPEERHLATPALFVGEDYLIGSDITADAVAALVEKYTDSGTERLPEAFDPQEGQAGIVERFKSFGVLTVAFAGLVDGLNPCAFATLVFFISYLALSGRQGKEVLAVGAAFTAGVFLAYLAVGLGFYQVLELLGDVLTTLGRWVYGLTGVFCAGLAVFSFLDFLKARRGEIGDMSLNLPHALRMRINAVIRRGRHSRMFVLGSFFTGVVVSFLELACTGQVYLPTIIFVMSQPDLRVRAVAFLVLYNLLFILPLVVVFIMAYYGTGSKQLTRFLEEQAPAVKLGMTILFTALAGWLIYSLVI